MNQPCCAGNTCSNTDALLCGADGNCLKCGSVGEPCCDNNKKCKDDAFCDPATKKCAVASGCGTTGAACCTGDSCNSGNTCQQGTCAACGMNSQPCCDGAIASDACHNGDGICQDKDRSGLVCFVGQSTGSKITVKFVIAFVCAYSFF